MKHRGSRTAVLLLTLATATVETVPGEPVPDDRSESVEAQAPDLRIAGWEIDDTVTGNGDLALQPGETAEIRVHLYNAGNQNAQGVYGQLAEVTDHPDVEVTGKVATWPDIPAFESLTASTTTFEIQVAPTRPCSWEIPLEMQIFASGGYFFEQRLTLSLQPVREIELAKDAGRPLVYGADMLDRFGSTSAAGDLNGDGLDDLIVGTHQAQGLTDLNPLTGEVVVRYGTPDRWADADLASPPASIGIIYPVSLSDQFGRDVATGDTDGNGRDEILIGFTRSDGPLGLRTDAGAVVALIGNDALTGSIDLNAPPPDVYFGTFHGIDPGDELGRQVVAADLNGDGFEEIVATALNADGATNGGNANGEVVIVYGRLYIFAGDFDLAAPSIPTTLIWGADPGDNLGRGLAAGDLDGDGYDDLILVSAGSGPENLRISAGEAVVIYGGPEHLPDVDLADPARPANIIRIYGRESDNLVAAAAGDLDGDGYDDLILGGSGGSTGAFDAGVVYVIYGGPARYGDVDLRIPPAGVGIISGLATGAETGSSLGVADLDGDGYGDLLIGSPEATPPGLSSAGIVTVLPGGPERIDFLSLQFPPATVTNILGAGSSQDLGVGAVGDFDGDGLDDILLEIPTWNGPANEFGVRAASGEVQLVPGQARHRYRHSAETFAFIDATLGGDLGLSCDDCSTTIPLGFEFDFYGRKHTEVTVSSNGYLTFGGQGDLLPVFCPAASSPPNGLIAPYWDDFDLSGGGSVHALLEGTAPNRRLTVEWLAVPDYEATGDVTFEVTLFESSDQILFQYLDATLTGAPGADQVVGVENETGRVGTSVACFEAVEVADGAAIRLRRYDNPFTVFEDDVETDPGWTPTGLWNRISFPSCYPGARSPGSSWYYGQLSTCDYDTGGTNSGTLTSPVIPDLGQDAEMTYWFRRETEGSPTFDLSFVRASGDGAPFVGLEQNLEETSTWRRRDDTRPLPLDLSSFVGQDLQVQFEFNTGDGIDNTHPGWMVDDIRVEACPVTGGAPMEAGAAAEARATARSAAICETEMGLVDAAGSYCNACSVSLGYQWSADGIPIPGAVGPQYAIPAFQPPGSYEYTVAIDCPANPGCDVSSGPAAVSVVARPGVVGATLQLEAISGGTELWFTWVDTPGSDDYVVLQSTDPSAVFTDAAGVGASGGTGLVLPLPSADLVFFRVAGRNAVCGEGPQ